MRPVTDDNGQWSLDQALSSGSDGDDEHASEWMPVVLTAIVAGAVVLICLVCGETIASVASIIWGKS